MGNVQCCVNNDSKMAEVEAIPLEADAALDATFAGSFSDILNAIFECSMTDDEILKVFSQLDTNKDGYLDNAEIYTALKNMGKLSMDMAGVTSSMPYSKLSAEQIKEFVREGNERVSRAFMSRRYTSAKKLTLRGVSEADVQMGKNFLELYGCEDLSDESLRLKFKKMDKEGQGVLSQRNLRTTFRSANTITLDDADKAVENMHRPVMNFEEFKTAVFAALKCQIVQAFSECPDVHSSGEVTVLDTKGLPSAFEKTLYELEKKAGVKTVKFAVFQDVSGRAQAWRIHAVTDEGAAMRARVPFPGPWRGLKGDALVKASGLRECVSVSRNGGVAVCKTKEAAIELCAKALEMV